MTARWSCCRFVWRITSRKESGRSLYDSTPLFTQLIKIARRHMESLSSSRPSSSTHSCCLTVQISTEHEIIKNETVEKNRKQLQMESAMKSQAVNAIPQTYSSQGSNMFPNLQETCSLFPLSRDGGGKSVLVNLVRIGLILHNEKKTIQCHQREKFSMLLHLKKVSL